MIKLANHSISNSKVNRIIPHSRIEDEDVIYKRYELGRKLGQGSYGVVYELKNKENDNKYAMKIINKEKHGCKSSLSFENEVNIMKSVTHPNLIKLEEVFETKKKLYLITELCEVGELAKFIKKVGPIPEPQSRTIMRQIVDAISYLHKHDIVHRDLKLENILVKEFDSENTNYYIKITDFGLSGQRATAGTESMFEEYCGTPLYMAPEIIDNYPYSQLCDVWALGIIMFFLLTGHTPFTADNESKLKEQIRKAEINTSLPSYLKLTAEAKDCLNRMIKTNPAHRITSSELTEHPWFLDKKLEEMPDKHKNVLELMTEMLHEQDNNRYVLMNSRDLNEEKANGDHNEFTANSINSSSSSNRSHIRSNTKATSSSSKLDPKKTVNNYHHKKKY